jgi:hypothetical protein
MKQRARNGLDGDLSSDFDDPSRWYLKEVGCIARRFRERDE